MKQGAILAAITALKQICNHPWNYQQDDLPLAGRSGKLNRLEEVVEQVFAAGERILIFTQFATWGVRLAEHLTEVTGEPIGCYHGGLARGARDAMIKEFQEGKGAGRHRAVAQGGRHRPQPHRRQPRRALRPLVEPGGRGPGPRPRVAHRPDRAPCCRHRLVCPGTVDERVEEVVAASASIADLVLPKSSSLADLDPDQLRTALGPAAPTSSSRRTTSDEQPGQGGSGRTGASAAGAARRSRSTSGVRCRRCPAPSRSCRRRIPPRCCAASAPRRCGPRSDMAEAYLLAVAERAAGLATALAAASGLYDPTVEPD